MSGKAWILAARTDPTTIAGWPFCGLITHLGRWDYAEKLLALGLPIVDTAVILPDLAIPRVAIDETALTRIAVRYFQDRGYRHLAYFSDDLYHPAPSARWQAFHDEIGRQTGLICHHPPLRPPDDPFSHRYHAIMVAWLAQLPKPIAILLPNDLSAEWLTSLSQEAYLRIPEDISLLGVGNNELSCLNNYPNTSSMELPGRKLGFEAAKLFDRLLRGDSPMPPAPPILLPPIHIVTRHSTDAYALEDSAVAAALRFIREHITEKFTVTDVVRATGVSRRVLETRCRVSTGRSLLEEIHQMRVERAKSLLAGTTLKIADVAARSGFTDSLHLRRTFARHIHMSPNAYRRKMRAG